MADTDTDMTKWQVAAREAFKTAKWAKIMTKWLITNSSKNGVKWQVVNFDGKMGYEPPGVVDLIAIRKNFDRPEEAGYRGDLFEIVLIQVKGGSADRPSEKDIERLSFVKQHHRADRVVLAEWKKAKKLCLYEWDPLEAIWDPQDSTWNPKFPEWKLVGAKEIFGIISKKAMLEIKNRDALKPAIDPVRVKKIAANTEATVATNSAKSGSIPLTAGEKAARTKRRNAQAKLR